MSSGVTKRLADLEPTKCSFVIGQGYLYMGLPTNGTASASFGAPTTLIDGKTYYLLHGGQKVNFVYKSGIWYPISRTGTRLAYTAEYLASWGWSYGGSVS